MHVCRLALVASFTLNVNGNYKRLVSAKIFPRDLYSSFLIVCILRPLACPSCSTVKLVDPTGLYAIFETSIFTSRFLPGPPEWQDDTENTSWWGLLCSFTVVKNFAMNPRNEFSPVFTYATYLCNILRLLSQLVEERMTGVLPRRIYYWTSVGTCQRRH